MRTDAQDMLVIGVMMEQNRTELTDVRIISDEEY